MSAVGVGPGLDRPAFDPATAGEYDLAIAGLSGGSGSVTRHRWIGQVPTDWIPAMSCAERWRWRRARRLV